MLWGNVRQPLQPEGIRQEPAEALHGLVVPSTGLEAALAVVAVELVHLGHQVQVMVCHMYTLSYIPIVSPFTTLDFLEQD